MLYEVITRCDNLQLAVLQDEPSPAAAELGGAAVLEGGSEFVNAANLRIDLV